VSPLIADATALPFADVRFDAVVSVHVFHLLPAWRVALAEVQRVLAPAGHDPELRQRERAAASSGVMSAHLEVISIAALAAACLYFAYELVSTAEQALRLFT
jgi:ubiquinone/menaquinone biosynthesis C-methylase UbiE